MLVNIKHEFVLIYVPKTGGTSIRSSLKLAANNEHHDLNYKYGASLKELKNIAVNQITKHETYIEFIHRLQHQTGVSFGFGKAHPPIAFVRDPILRFINLHSYLLKKERNRYPFVPFDINHWCATIRERHGWINSLRGLRPQAEFLHGCSSNMSLGRFEFLEDKLNLLAKCLGLELKSRHKNAQPSLDKSPDAGNISDKNMKFLRDFYCDDCSAFKLWVKQVFWYKKYSLYFRFFK